MAKLATKPKPSGRWSTEQLRQRGVRAAVEFLRLRQERQKLARQNADHLDVTRGLRHSLLEQVWSVTQSLRASLDRRNDPTLRSIGKGNFWVNGNHSAETNGADSKNKRDLTPL